MSVAEIQGEIQADHVSLADDVAIGPGSNIRAQEAILEPGVRIGQRVDITCDRIHLSRGCRIGDFSTILSPEIAFADHCVVGRFLSAELNDHIRLGRHSNIGEWVSVVGRGFQCGEFLWLKNSVIIGGGGARGPNSYLTVGDKTTIIDRCFINLSESVTIGDRTALSYNVVLLTHGAWQSPFKGYATKFAPIRIEDDVVVYLNTTVMPGVTIGKGSVVGASSLVLHDVPAHCLAAGVPARVRKKPGEYPVIPDPARFGDMTRQILTDYLTSLGPKGIRIKNDRQQREGKVVLEYEGEEYVLEHIGANGQPGTAGQVRVVRSGSPPSAGALRPCRFDLCAESMTGESNPIAEDLRDHLRRNGIRIFTERPFRSIPLANLKRLAERKARDAERRSDSVERLSALGGRTSERMSVVSR
jgi:acetyltransferase-like isoleucine patch superfamily enzyme